MRGSADILHPIILYAAAARVIDAAKLIQLVAHVCDGGIGASSTSKDSPSPRHHADFTYDIKRFRSPGETSVEPSQQNDRYQLV